MVTKCWTCGRLKMLRFLTAIIGCWKSLHSIKFLSRLWKMSTCNKEMTVHTLHPDCPAASRERQYILELTKTPVGGVAVHSCQQHVTIKLLMLRKRVPVGVSLFPLGPISFALSIYTPTGNTFTPLKATSVLVSVPPTQGGRTSGVRVFQPGPPLRRCRVGSRDCPGSGPGLSLSGSRPPSCCCGQRGRRRWRRRRCCCCPRRRGSGTLGRSWLSGIGDRTRRRR